MPPRNLSGTREKKRDAPPSRCALAQHLFFFFRRGYKKKAPKTPIKRKASKESQH